LDTRGVSEEALEGIGGVPRELSDILTEVAEGRAELTHFG
jgi:hypothetical protein